MGDQKLYIEEIWHEGKDSIFVVRFPLNQRTPRSHVPYLDISNIHSCQFLVSYYVVGHTYITDRHVFPLAEIRDFLETFLADIGTIKKKNQRISYIRSSKISQRVTPELLLT